MDTPPSTNNRFSRTVEVGWHIISGLVLVFTIITGAAIGYGYIAVQQTKLDRVVEDQREDRNALRLFSTEVRVSLEKISDQIAGLRTDVAKKH